MQNCSGEGSRMDVVAGVLVDNDLVLACRRKPGLAEAGCWEFPGGKLEPGESPEAALQRELREELALEVEVCELFDRSTTVVGDRAITLWCYLVQTTGEPPSASTDHDLVSWFPKERLGWLNWSAPDLPCVRRLTVA